MTDRLTAAEKQMAQMIAHHVGVEFRAALAEDRVLRGFITELPAPEPTPQHEQRWGGTHQEGLFT